LGNPTKLYTHTIANHGREKAQRLWAFSTANYAYALEFMQELDMQGWSCDYQQNGFYKLAINEVEFADIIESTRFLNEDGYQSQIVQRNELPECLRKAYLGGTYFSSCGELHPARFVKGMAKLAEQAGAVFHEESPVTKITIGDNGILLSTPRGTLHVQKLILATNAWLPEIGKLIGADWLARVITPTRGQVIATEPISERLLPCPCSANERYQYWRQLPDGRLIVGGWRNCSFETETFTYEETPYDGIQQHLDAFVHKTLNLPDVHITNRWAGIMAYTPDSIPLVGPVPGIPCCYICGGYTGHGNAFAINCARLISELVLGKTNPDAELFDPERLQ
jgi:glycine/D-amino acid oxidase-like deaminating enzyme